MAMGSGHGKYPMLSQTILKCPPLKLADYAFFEGKMERSFARGTRYGIKQVLWRRLWRAEIQE